MKKVFSGRISLRSIGRGGILLLGAVLLVACGAGARPSPAALTATPAPATTVPATPTTVPTLATEVPTVTTATPILSPQPSSTVAPTLSPTIVPSPTTSTAPPVAAQTLVPQQSAAGTLVHIPRTPAELRGAWVHDNSLVTAAKIDEIIRRAELGHINAIFANVFTEGQALFNSQYVEKSRLVKADWDPLAYLVSEAHKRNIQVHAWFVNGPVDHDGVSAIIAKHPEWALVGPDGQAQPWLNFARPEVRQFLGDLMLETVTRYGVDGIHFDFTRYPGPQWGFDSYTVQAFNASHDFDVSALRYAELPAYSYFESNLVLKPTSAQVLAEFADGTPAITLNQYGAGQALLFNWRASERRIAAESIILKRAVESMLKPGGQVYLYRTAATTGNSEDFFNMANAWLTELGWTPAPTDAGGLASLQPGSVIVMPDVYTFSSQEAAQLATFEQAGGGVIFIEGPNRSMSLPEVQALLGMSDRGKHFADWTLLQPVAASSLVPVSANPFDPVTYTSRDTQWKDFRKLQVTSLIQEIRQRVSAAAPGVELTATITPDQENAAQQVLQDWNTWLQQGLVDFLIPRGYVPELDALDPILANWQPSMLQYKRIVIGLSTFGGKGKDRIPKDPNQLLGEVAKIQQAGSNGVMLWNLDYMSDAELQALANGPFYLGLGSQ